MKTWQDFASIVGWLALLLPNMAHAASVADPLQGNNRESATGCGASIDTGLSNHLKQRLLYSKLVYSKDRHDETGSAAAAESVKQPELQTLSTLETSGRRFFWCAWQAYCRS